MPIYQVKVITKGGFEFIAKRVGAGSPEEARDHLQQEYFPQTVRVMESSGRAIAPGVAPQYYPDTVLIHREDGDRKFALVPTSSIDRIEIVQVGPGA